MTPEELDEKDAEDLATAEVDDDDLEEDAETDEDEEEEDAALPDDDEEDDQASLEELLAQRAAGRKAAEESDEDEDIMALASEPDEPPMIELPTKVAPIREQKEFVCKSCYLVKPRVQLADAKREYCRDCV